MYKKIYRPVFLFQSLEFLVKVETSREVETSLFPLLNVLYKFLMELWAD